MASDWISTGARRVLGRRRLPGRGVPVRIALGDPGGKHAANRSGDEGIDNIVISRVRDALVLFALLMAEPGIQLRLNDTVLYNSIYWADDELLINTHAYGCPASHALVLHVVRTRDDGMAAMYAESFERIWSSARPA